jgi:hypothetical protein
VDFTVIDGSNWEGSLLVTMVQPQGRDDLFAVTRNGVLINLSTGGQRPVVPREFGFITRIHNVSRDDCRIEIQTTNSQIPMLLDVQLEQTTPLGRLSSLEPGLDKFLPNQVNVRKHFSGIAVNHRGQLVLISRNGRPVNLSTDYRRLVLREANPHEESLSNERTFQPIGAPSAYNLKYARWDDGSIAWLDSRGLLHLRSSDKGIPELTIVLNSGLLGGWCSDGGMFGHSFFLGPAQSDGVAASARIIDEVLSPFIRGLQ